ncbi:CPBP family intramembrane glutamic endopeptidase [Pedobacter borealis]|uniref:CPBP family intramembrane glutamic endopeptidase n=1 Tax=Pedobacter borealis TaxID=475254 RepID=UPI0004937FA2|nr:CPBP family intramembrane glutamic endopeptidase [Pedobacter borealis]
MNFVTPNKEEINPFLQLLLLLFYAVIGTIVFITLSLVIIAVFYGVNTAGEVMGGQITDANISAFKIFQALGTSIGMMAVPAIVLALTEHKKVSDFYGFKNTRSVLIILVLIIMLVSMPFMEWTMLWNQKMVLPDFLKGIEKWMKEKENATMGITLKLVTVRSNLDFIANLIIIAVLPAIGEELMFRGGVQRSLNRAFENPHLAIWLSAIIFSAIHVQFYGFVPRMLLGAGFGYLYYYSGSIWYAMLAHFINNAYAVCAAFYMQKHHMPLDKADEPIGFPWYGYLISAIITIALFKIFKDSATRERKLG